MYIESVTFFNKVLLVYTLYSSIQFFSSDLSLSILACQQFSLVHKFNEHEIRQQLVAHASAMWPHEEPSIAENALNRSRCRWHSKQ